MDDPNIRITPYEQALAGITKDLADLRANLLGKLSREIITLQSQKNALADDIQRLQAQRTELEVQIVSQQGLNQQEIQRQQWIEQLAQAIAVHLRSDLHASNAKSVHQYSETFDHLMLNLDTTLRMTFQALQRDIDSYQTDIDQQMGRMHGQRQQGEQLLAALVEKLDEQLRYARSNNSSTNGNGAALGDRYSNGHSTESLKPDIIYVSSPQSTTAPTQQSKPEELSAWWRGFILVLLASVSLSLQNVFTRIVFRNSLIFGSLKFGGLLGAGIPNSLMVLMMRMLFAMPAMWLVARFIFQVDASKDIRELVAPEKRGLLLRVVGSSVLQFASFTCIFIAISLMKPALAVTIFFIFPTVTVLLAWFLFGDRPNALRWLVIAIIYAGIVLTFNAGNAADHKADLLGVIASLLSGITFAGYIITSQACFKQINPVSFTVISFSIILFLCCCTVPVFWSSLSLDPRLWFMCFLIALTSLAGYLFTNFGTKLMGAAQASIVGASGPVFTTLLAFGIVGDKLEFGQVLGVFLVTFGVGLLSLQNLYKKPRPS